MSNAVAEGVISIGAIQEKYNFKRKLGKGGFCDVFLAENRESGEKVAIKMMEMDPAGEKVDRRVARFRREMMLYSQLDHPNIVKVLDSGETETGLLFIVFEYIPGNNLAELLKKEGALSLARTMTLMGQVLSALNEAHAKGIIHRDLKPENIMVVAADGTERIKILDFGISTFISGQFSETPRITQTREFLGTPTYAAPEQLRGDPVSTKVDIYAWGLLFLECITGKSPFTGASVAAVVQQQLASSPVPLPAALVNHRLGTLLRWTLEKDANRRAGNVLVISSHLEAVSPEGIAQKNGYLTDEPMTDRLDMVHEIMIYETVTSSQERRQVTVVCATLNIQGQQDMASPDVLDEIYQDLMAFGCDIFRKFGAHIVNDTGDRILAFFGYPDASDSDARRAARSALELAMSFARRNTVFSVQHGLQFSYRIGIHTGMVTVRKDSGNRPKLSGLTLNLLGKLCNAADANSIFMSKSSYLLLKDIVECQEVAPDAAVESFSHAPVYKMLGEQRMEGYRGIDGSTISPMVGRNGEMARLQDAWKATGKEGTGKVLLLQGEAGIGKSRLAAEFAKKVLQANGGWMECRCLPEGKNSALHPIFAYLRNHFGLSRNASAQNNINTLEKHLQSFGIDCSVGIPLFCSWLGLPTDGFTMPPLSPQRQKEFVLNTSSEILARIAQASSSVIMIEDLHWADPTTLEMLPRLFEQVKQRSLLLLMTARSVFVQAWKSTDAEIVTIERLEDTEVEVIIRSILGSGELSRDTVAKIIAKVDGVPLFVEEVTRLIREKGANKDEIPATLRDLLTGKIDHLGPAKETAQLAAVIGRAFDYSLIEKVSLKDAASLLADLDQLISAGGMHVQLIVGNPHYVFHHALVRDAAYESLDKKMREEMHHRIADTLERDSGDITASQPELLAYHWAGAGAFEKATEYGIQAATQYLTRSLYTEAIHHATVSLEWTPKIKDDNLRIDRELQLLQLLIPSYISTKGFAAPELDKINSRTEELRGKLPDDSAFLTSILWGKVIYYEATPDYSKMEYYMREALVKGKKNDNVDLLSALYSVKSHFNCSHGAFKESIGNADDSIEYYKKKKIQSHATVFGHDSKVLSLGVKALSLTIYGDIYSACESMDKSIEFATSINDPSSKGLAFVYQLCMLHIRNEKDVVEKYCNEFKIFINKYGLELWRNVAELHYGWATGDVEKVKQCLTIFQMIGLGQLAPYWNFIAAQTEFDRGLYTDCLKRVETYITHSNSIGEIYYLPELYRLKALCMARIDAENVKEIEANFNNAFEFADKIEAHLFKLRALLDCYKASNKSTTRNECIGQLAQTVNIFKRFKRYEDHYEIMDAMKIFPINN